MSKYKVLVDSSVWIDYFKSGNILYLDKLLEEDLVCTNELILTELVPVLLHQKRGDIVESLDSLEKIPLNIDWEIIRELQILNLKNGIKRVGIPDLIIIQQVMDQNMTLFSFEKHFLLMKNQLKFELISSS
jgi:predicted nucleic acid-binding protein